MGIVIDKLIGNTLLIEIKETDLTTALQAKVASGSIAGIFEVALPSENIVSNKIYEYAGVNATEIGGITWYNGDSAWYSGDTWYRIPFQSLANYYTKSEIIASYPFKLITTPDDVKSFIQDIRFTGIIDPTYRCFVYFIARKNVGDTNAWGLFIKNEAGVTVSQFYVQNYTPTSQIEWLTLYAVGVGGLSGEILVDWSVYADGYTSPAYTLVDTEISNKTYIERILDSEIITSKIAPSAVTGLKLEDTPTYDTHHLLFGNKLFLVENQLLPIYKKGIISNDRVDKNKVLLFDKDYTTDIPFIEYIENQTKISSTNLPTSLRIANSVYDYTKTINDDNESVLNYKDITVEKCLLSDISTKTASVIVIGDSFVQRGAVSLQLEKNLNTTWGADINFQGTITNGTKNEGKASWGWRNLVGMRTTRTGSDSITPLLTGDVSTIQENPFIRIATSEELAAFPEMCFENQPSISQPGVAKELNYTQSQVIGTYTGDYYIFSFTSYVANHSITVGNNLVVHIGLGINDLYYSSPAWSETGIDEILDCMQFAVTQIWRYSFFESKNVHIGITPLSLFHPSYLSEVCIKYIEKFIIRAEWIMANGINNLDLISTFASTDRLACWNINTGIVDVTVNNNSLVGYPSDEIHPTTFGMNQIGNVISYYIANKIK